MWSLVGKFEQLENFNKGSINSNSLDTNKPKNGKETTTEEQASETYLHTCASIILNKETMDTNTTQQYPKPRQTGQARPTSRWRGLTLKFKMLLLMFIQRGSLEFYVSTNHREHELIS